MGQQVMGTIETSQGTAHAMLCIDSDQPDEFMFHFWGDAIRDVAVLMKSRRDGKTLNLSPTVVYRVTADGNVTMPSHFDLTPEELAFKSNVTARLEENDGGGYIGDWTDPEGITRKVELKLIAQFSDSGLEVVTCVAWSEFKTWADQARTQHQCTAFRGHGSNAFSLQTTLSRVGRTRMHRYCFNELPHFKNLLEASMNMRFDLSNAEDYATVVGLAQHHGLPTPLLDWTASPYVAAFFALSDAIEMAQNRNEVKFARVYGLTQAFINRSSPPIVTISANKPYVLSLMVSPRHNPRLLAQQGRFLVTNIQNVESYIQFTERQDKMRHLYAVDIPIGEAPRALEDLAFMGLTAATMFPGLDGVGKMIRHQMLFGAAKAQQLMLQTT